VAILSGDEDELLCKLVSPRISSVELASHRIGMEACHLLARMMRTGRVPSKPKLIQPLRICARRSTDNLVVDNPDIAAAVRYIWSRAADSIQVKDLLRIAHMSRRTLEQRFLEHLGRTPAEEIRRVRLEQARKLILESAMPVSSIALACGFSSGPYLTHAFRRRFGVTPSDLRAGRTGNRPSSA
jgi:LacI family transcriptional regulator